MEPLPDESRPGSRTTRDLSILAALPAEWIGVRPLQLAEELADLLVRNLSLDLGYLRLRFGQGDRDETEVARAIQLPIDEVQTREIGLAFAPWLNCAETHAVRSVTDLLGSGTMRVIVVPIGSDGAEGWLVAGSRQGRFPDEDVCLLLDVVARQVSTSLAYRRSEESRRRLQRERDGLLKRLRLQLEHMPVACIVHDPQGHIIDWNPAAEMLFGYRRDEVVGKNGDLLLSQPSCREYALAIDRCLASEDSIGPVTSETVAKDGRILLCEWHYAAMRDADGEVIAIQAVAQDVTERMRTEEKLRQSESLLAEAQRLTHIGSWSWDISSGTVLWSDELYRIFGLKPEETAMTLERFLSLVHPDDRVILRNANEEAIRDDRLHECDYRIRLEDGSVRILRRRVRPVLAEDRTPIRMFGTSQDITERRRDEEALEESRRRFQAVFDNSLDGILLLDDTGHYVDANPSICQLLGYSRDELLQLTPRDLTPAPDDQRFHELMRQFFADGKVSGEYTLLCKDGTSRETEYRNVANVLPGVHLGVFRDITDRKNAERALQNRHNLLHAVIEGIPETIFVKDVHGRYLMMNTEGAHIVGRTPEETTGCDDAELFDSETARRFRENDRQVIETGESSTFEEIVTMTGAPRTYLTTKSPFRSTDGQVVGTLGIARDITESRALLAERDQLLDRLRLQIDRLPLAYLLVDENLRVVNWNPVAERMFGYTKVEALGQVCLDLILPPQIDAKILEVIRRLESGDMHAHLINENRTKDGRIITCEWYNTPLIDPNGKFNGFISLGLDISDRRLMEAEAAVLHAALENAVEGISQLDRQGHYVSVNRAYADMLGYHSEELIGMSLQLTIHPDDWEKLEAVQRVMVSEGRAEAELRCMRKDNSVFWKQTVMVKIEDPQGQWIGHYRFMKDITERKRTEEALRDSAERLQVLSRRVVELEEQQRRHVARELHDEIGQVLSAISLDLHVLQSASEAGASSRIEETIRIIDEATQQVRDLSLELRPSMLDDLGLAATLRWYADRQAQRAGFAVTTTVESNGARVPVELSMACFRVMQEALTNVARHAKAQRVWVEFRQDDDSIELIIRDDGVSFDLESVRRRAVRGESFGLLGILERVELLGGTATVQSRPGEGTSIRVRFPMSAMPDPEAVRSVR